MVENTSPLLTDKQYKAIVGDFETLTQPDRSRLRDRIIGIIEDFALLAYLPDKEIDKLFRKGFGENLNRSYQNATDTGGFQTGIFNFHVFLWSGLRMGGWDIDRYEHLLEEAISEAEMGGDPWLIGMTSDGFTKVDVEVEIEVTKTYHQSISESREAFLDGKSISGEELKQVLNDVPREEIETLVERYDSGMDDIANNNSSTDTSGEL